MATLLTFRNLCIVTALFVLFAAPTLAATVSKENGIGRGSIAYAFTYDENDAETIITGVRQNDLIRIVYGTGATGLPLKREYYFKQRFEERWNYEIIGGEKGLSLLQGEPVDVDLQNDGTVDLLMTFDGVDGTDGTFTLTNANAAATPSGDGTVAENETVVDDENAPTNGAATDDATNGLDEGTKPDETNGGQNAGSDVAEPGAQNTDELGSWLPALTAVVVILLIGGAVIALVLRKKLQKQPKPPTRPPKQ